MSSKIKVTQSTDPLAWDAYVNAHPLSTLYHLSGWKDVIENAYGHKTYYLIATNPTNSTNPTNPTNSTNPINPTNPIVGILPLVHLKHFLFGNSLISMPFFDLGGIIANDNETEMLILSEAVKIGQKLGARQIELRHTQPLSCLNPNNPINPTNPTNPINPINPNNPITHETKSHKVRMLLELPRSSDILMESFKSKLRSQIKKPIKEGLHSKIGGRELVDDFYNVFSRNMRDLGSPVHSKRFITSILDKFSESVNLIIVYKSEQPVACSLIAGFKDTLENPWASALQEYSRLSPNMLLYWTMLKYACDNGFSFFDFGRSSPGEGTYKFKEQWGAKPFPLHWHYISLYGAPIKADIPERSKFDKAISVWQKIPVQITKIIGPMIRKHIGL